MLKPITLDEAWESHENTQEIYLGQKYILLLLTQIQKISQGRFSLIKGTLHLNIQQTLWNITFKYCLNVFKQVGEKTVWVRVLFIYFGEHQRDSSPQNWKNIGNRIVDGNK